MAKVIGIHHVAIAIPEIEDSLIFWRDQLGLELDHIEDVPSQESQVAFLPLDHSEIELVKPTSDDSGLAKYLHKKGPGLHHLCFEVDDLGEMLAELKEKDVQLIDEQPRILPNRKMAFIHPKSTNGVLVELYEITN
jgi:methylmalonyl-CoA/ethylmalonyl-CoA epimerase